MRYESLWFDRAHDKIFDVLVMNGVLGLLSYSAIWFLLFRLAFKRITEKEYAVPIIFFGSAYFVQNLFVFDQISTYIPFFALLAFTVFASSEGLKEVSYSGRALKMKSLVEKIAPYKLPIIATFFSFALVSYTLVPYSQSVSFIKSIQTGDAQVVLDSVESFSEPYNYAQSTIRNRLATMIMPLVGNPEMVGVVNTALSLQEEYIARQPYDPRDLSLVGNIYRLKGNFGEPGGHEKAIEYELRALKLSPNRQDHLYGLATLYADRGDFVNMNEYADRLISSAPTVARNKILYGTIILREGPTRYAEAAEVLNSALLDPKIYFSGDQEKNVLRLAYDLFIGHFYETRDSENFLSAMEGARDLEIRFQEIYQAQLDNGLIEALPVLRVSEFDRNIELFNSGGWGAIVIGQ